MDDQTEKLNSRARKQWRVEQWRAMIGRILRWAVGISLLAFCFPIPGFGPFLMLLGAILIAPEIAGYLSEVVVNCLWPHRKSDRMPLYAIPETLVARGQYAAAEEEYEKIIEEFPAEVKPHVDMINIAITRLNDGELAEDLYRRGLSSLRDPDSKEILTEMYTAIMTRLK